MFDSQLNSGFTYAENINVSTQFTEISLIHASSNGYSQVYKGKRYGKWHVLKCLTKEAMHNQLFQTLLEKEFEIAYSLNHPNIIHTLGMERVDDLGWCIVQEYIEGTTLQTLHQQQLEQLCDALIYIHKQGITHRDLKPENILVVNHTNQIVLIDFGLADKADYAILKQTAGTTGYIPPEQLLEGTITPQGDIFALGVILSNYKKWKRVAKKCQSANPQKRYVSVMEVKKAILTTSPWIAKGMSVLLVMIILLIGLWYQLYIQKNHLLQQEQVILQQEKAVIVLDSTNLVLTKQILDYQSQIDSLKTIKTPTISAQEVDSLKKQLRQAQDRYDELFLVLEEYREEKERKELNEYLSGPTKFFW